MERSKAIITIGRQTGSGGREVGRKLAEKLGIKCYDRELITTVAKESGLDEKVVESHDEKPISSLIYSLYMGANPFTLGSAAHIGEMPLDHQIFLAQFEAIKKIAERESCVIVGRCADYALQGNPNLLSVFILGNEEDRIERQMKRMDINAVKAKEFIQKTDRKRQNYYNFYADKKWGYSTTYDLCVNSSAYGIDGSVDLILHAIDAHSSKGNQ